MTKKVLWHMLSLLLCCGILFALPLHAFAVQSTADTWDGTSDTSWYDNSKTEFHLTTAEQLAGMAKLLKQKTNSFSGKTIYLETDVDLQNIPWTPIGDNFNDESGHSYSRLSNATFDGQGHVISNLNINASGLVHGANCGLFGFVEDSSISNLGIEHGKIVNDGDGFEDGLLAGKMNNCTVKGCYATGTATETGAVTCVGGLIGQIYSDSSTKPVVIEQCYAEVEITAGTDTQATIAGLCTGSLWSRTQDLIIRDCYSTGTIKAESESANVAGLAAVISWMPVYGQENPQEATRGVIENCFTTVALNTVGYTADFAINDGKVKNSCWIKQSDQGCLAGLDACTPDDTCKALSKQDFPKESMAILAAGREDSPWVAYVAGKGPVLSIQAHHYSANYTDVDAAIAKANGLNKSDYKDFLAVEAAINAAARGKNITEQATVNGYADAIEHAITALEYKDADYSKVDAAIAKANGLNKSDYKDFSAVEAAINAAARDKNITEQATVDGYADAIEHAITALEYKDADYSKVDAAIAKANGLNKSDYKDFSAVEAAINAVARDKNMTEQATVNGYATAIERAISSLEKKIEPAPTEQSQPGDPTKPSEKNPNAGTNSPQTGDQTDLVIWFSLLLVSMGGIGVTILYRRRMKSSKLKK